MTLQKLLLKNIYGVGIYKYLGEFLYFLSSIIISRLLLPEEFGVVAMSTIFYRFVMIFTDLGVSEAIIREERNRDFLRNAHNLYIVIGVAACIVIALAAYPISIFFKQQVLLFVMFSYALAVLLYALPKAMIAHLRKRNRLLLVAKIELVAVMFLISCTVFLAWAGFSYWSLVLPHMVVPVLYYFIYRQYVNIPFTPFTTVGIRAVWIKARSLIYNIGPLYLLQYWERTTDKLLVGRVHGESALGLYSRAFSMVSLLVTMLEGHVNATLLPLLSRNNLSQFEVRSEMISFIKLSTAVLTLPAVVFVLYSHEVAVILWGDKWIEVGDYLGPLGIALLIVSFDKLSVNLFVIFRKEKLMLLVGVVKGVSVICLVIFGSLYSIELMIYLYLTALLFIGFPAMLYFGYYKSLGFSFVEIMDTMFFQYCLALIVFFLKFSEFESALLYPSILLIGFSMLNIGQYVRKLN